MRTAPPPLVSVLVPTRNRASLLPRALESVWAQRRDDVEVLVVDDASTDGTDAYLASLARQGRVRHLRNDRPLGACVARNRALREARGMYVTCLDDDDEMLPGRLDAMLRALRPTDSFVCSAHVAVTPDGRRHYRPCARDITLQRILARNVASTFLARRDRVLACGGFDESLPAAQDHDLWIRMIAMFGPARGIPEPLQLVHEAGEGRISTSSRRRSGYWMVYRKHKQSMDRITRATHLYNLHKANRKRLGLGGALTFFVRGNRLRVASRLVSERLPFLSSAVRKVAECYARMPMR